MKKVLVTGVAGFAGSHLAEYLISKKFAVFGFFHPDHATDNVNHLKRDLTLIPCNLLNQKDLQKKTAQIIPDYVFHLAAFSSPVESFKNPQKTLANNIFAQIYLLQSLVAVSPKTKVLVVGSADEYGNIDLKHLPANEETPLAPVSPYAVSKVAQDMLGLQFFLHHKLHIVRVRPFNHIGPRQSKSFVVASFAAQIAAIEQNKKNELNVGNLQVWRDFTDVRDMVRAYLLALEIGVPPDVYNIGTGNAVKIADILKKLMSFSKTKIKIKKDKNLFRPVEINKIYCDFSKFRRQTGWSPKIPLDKTLFDTIEYERNKLKSETLNSKN